MGVRPVKSLIISAKTRYSSAWKRFTSDRKGGSRDGDGLGKGPSASSPASIPPLEPGDRLSRAEFERRYDAMPNLKKAELIEGVVYMPSPVRVRRHGRPHFHLITWLGNLRNRHSGRHRRGQRERSAGPGQRAAARRGAFHRPGQRRSGTNHSRRLPRRSPRTRRRGCGKQCQLRSEHQTQRLSPQWRAGIHRLARARSRDRLVRAARRRIRSLAARRCGPLP